MQQQQNKQQKITEIGQACRHCGTAVERRQHKRTWRKYKRGGYYFEWWLACPKCHAIYHQEIAKRLFDDPEKDQYDLMSAEEFTRGAK